MDKQIAKQLREIAESLPIVYDYEEEEGLMSGRVLNLSGYGEFRKFDNNMMYTVPYPVLRAVEHKQQLKDAFKRAQMKGVYEYVQSVVA